VIPVFSRKPLFGYAAVVFAGMSIGVLGFAVWSHHMFTTGLGTVPQIVFSASTMAIAVPTGVKIFNWMGTLYGGDLRFTSPEETDEAFLSGALHPADLKNGIAEWLVDALEPARNTFDAPEQRALLEELERLLGLA
jgi:hypothetical protein